MQFGQSAWSFDGHFTTAAVQALTEEHRLLSAAQTVSGQVGQGVYAQIWRSLPTALSTALASTRHDVQLIKPGRAPYSIPVVGDALLFPWRPPGGHSPTDIPFSTSPTRGGLWSLSNNQDPLDLGSAAEGVAEAGEVELDLFAEARRRQLKVILVAMTVDRHRLHRIEWGEAALRPDAYLSWVSHEVLFDADIAAGPTDAAPGTFAEGPLPALEVRVKPVAGETSSEG